jgi:acyl-CoA synthetase (AMP-forming)/AMP-acid ligase II
MDRPELDYPATMPGVLRHAATTFGDQPFIVTATATMTYAGAERASRRVAKDLLAAGVGKGTRVGIMFPYGTDWVLAWLAVTRIGALCMPFSTSYKPAELRKALRHGDVDTLLVPATLFGADHQAFVEEAVPGLADSAGPAHFLADLPYLRHVRVAGGGRRAWAEPLDLSLDDDGAMRVVTDEHLAAVEAEVAPGDQFLTIYTSGTTSDPKGVVHTHGNFLRHGANLARFQGLGPSDRIFCAMPFFWIGGVGCALNMALASGNTLLCLERFEADAALDMMEREQATGLSAWPALGWKLRRRAAESGRDLTAIPAFAPPPPGTPTTEDPELRHNSLGMTETVGPHSGPGPEATRVLPEALRGSFGLLVPHVERRIADPVTNATVEEGQVGEVCIRGYSVMQGLYKKERHEAFDADGWYHTGDKGYVADGCLFFEGRLSEMIKTSGSNVAPREVELALEAFPEVGTAVVLGVPDPERGERVGAVLAARPGSSLDTAAIVERLGKEISSYKVPSRILVLEESAVPQLPSGKVDKVTLRRLLADTPDLPRT